MFKAKTMGGSLTPSQTNALNTLAVNLGANPDWLWAIIQSESSWNPLAANPSTSAQGLIQFMDATAKGLGYASSQDLIDQHPDVEGQLLGPVQAYLEKFKPFPTFESVVGAVFYPANRYNPTKPLPGAAMQANSGISSVQSYADLIRKRLGLAAVSASSIVLGLAAFTGVFIWIVRSGRLPWKS
jgi:hypothetical protein